MLKKKHQANSKNLHIYIQYIYRKKLQIQYIYTKYIYNIYTVSYTHLDVYKRQNLASPLGI